ncbi:hypothetical protein JRC04_25825 [Mycolicibacterium sp. S2-37]|uniref:PE domain-containing protein n=1 Tax=Mycolicibacterium sp. S2-37 TaxID=2810297 RepID=UPI001A9469C8|nr:PE domain-containing protein [Mycolicibacterium sp. S2-37]MBO0680901.1 hypothetical protein [Mycolicibacterium sp. S2-37]
MEPFKKPEGISWDAASVELPEMPMVPPGEDAMSATIAAVLPTLSAPFTANVAALQAKEGMFSGKLVSAQAAYTNADDQGGQGVGQFTDMLGQLGKMGSQAAGSMGQGAGGGQGGGMFGSMMEQAMKAAQQFGGQAGGSGAGAGGQSGGAPAPAPAAGAGGAPAPQAPPQDRAPESRAEQTREPDQRSDEKDRDSEQRQKLDRAQVAGPDPGATGAGPAPVAPPQPSTDAEIEDLARRML